VHEIQDKRLRKALVGPSTKEGKSLKNNIRRRKEALHKLLDQLYLWKVVGTEECVEAHKMTDDAIKDMLRTGEGPWVAGVGAAIYWGKLAHRCQSDLARCKEEVVVLHVEKRRLGEWVALTLEAIQRRVQVVGEDSGRGVLLGRMKRVVEKLSLELSQLKW
jgi:hypothetical protein